MVSRTENSDCRRESLVAELAARFGGNGGKVAILAGHYMVTLDPEKDRLVPLVRPDLDASSAAGFAEFKTGDFPAESLQIGVELLKALRAKHVDGRIVLLADDNNLSSLPRADGSCAPVTGERAFQLRQEFFHSNRVLPLSYRQLLTQNDFNPAGVFADNSNARRNVTDILPRNSFLHSEVVLRRRFNRRTKPKLLRLREIRREYPKEGRDEIFLRAPKGTESTRLTENGFFGCAADVIQLLVELVEKGYDRQVWLVPSDCAAQVKAGLAAAITLLSTRGEEVQDLALVFDLPTDSGVSAEGKGGLVRVADFATPHAGGRTINSPRNDDMTLQVLNFRRTLQTLIKPFRPHGGLVYLLLEHSFPGTYMVLSSWPPLEEVDVPYYLLPFRFTGEYETDIEFEPDEDPDALIDRARLECLLGKIPCSQKVHVIEQAEVPGDKKLLLVRSGRNVRTTPERDHLLMLRAAHYIIQNWESLGFTTMSFNEISSIQELASQLADRISDTHRNPPYFPFLDASVIIEGETGGGRVQQFVKNPLSWNCLFLTSDVNSALPYLVEMQQRKEGFGNWQWWEDLATYPGLLDQLDPGLRPHVYMTVDLVRVIIRFQVDNHEWWVLARHNKLRQDNPSRAKGTDYAWAADPAGDPPLARSTEEAIRVALQYQPEDDDTFVTIYALRTERAGAGLEPRVIPIGLSPGDLSHKQAEEMSLSNGKEFREGPVKVISSSLQDVDQERMRELLDPLLKQAAVIAAKITPTALDIVKTAVADLRAGINEGGWPAKSGGKTPNLFGVGQHSINEWDADLYGRCVPPMQDLLGRFLAQLTRQPVSVPGGSLDLAAGWDLRVLKAVSHGRLHPALLVRIFGGESSIFDGQNLGIAPVGDVSLEQLLLAFCDLRNELFDRLEVHAVADEEDEFGLVKKHIACVIRASEVIDSLKTIIAAMSNDHVTDPASRDRGREKQFTRGCAILRQAAVRTAIEREGDKPLAFVVRFRVEGYT